MGQLVFLVASLVAIGVAWGELRQQVTNLNLDTLETNARVAIQVAGQHGNELNMIRKDDAIMRGEMLQIRAGVDEIRKEIRMRTDDRYRRSDAIVDQEKNKAWLNERFKNVIQRIEHLESEHHNPNDKRRQKWIDSD